jgi:hypothetical protein
MLRRNNQYVVIKISNYDMGDSVASSIATAMINVPTDAVSALAALL